MPVVVGRVESRVFVNHTTEKTSVQGAVGYETDAQFITKGQHSVFFHRTVHEVIFTLNGCNGADFVRTTNGFDIYLAHSPMQDFTFFDKFADRFGNDLDRCIRVDAVLIEHAECFHAKVTQGVLAYAANVCRSAVLFRLYLHAVHKLVSEFGRNEYPVGVSFQGFAYQFFIDMVAIAFCGVKKGNTTFDGFTYQCYFIFLAWILAAVVV